MKHVLGILTSRSFDPFHLIILATFLHTVQGITGFLLSQIISLIVHAIFNATLFWSRNKVRMFDLVGTFGFQPTVISRPGESPCLTLFLLLTRPLAIPSCLSIEITDVMSPVIHTKLIAIATSTFHWT